MINVKENEKEKNPMSNSIRRASCAHTTDQPNVYIGGEWFSNSKWLETNSAKTGGRLSSNWLANENDVQIVYMWIYERNKLLTRYLLRRNSIRMCFH